MSNYKLIFGKSILKKLRKIDKKSDLKDLVSKMLDKIEEKGPNVGKLLDPVINLYEIKSKKPPLRLYFEIIFEGNKAEIIDFEMKKSNLNFRWSLISVLKNKAFSRDHIYHQKLMFIRRASSFIPYLKVWAFWLSYVKRVKIY